MNKIYCGDNLKIMKDMKDESVDLIYLDPPFFSGRNYEDPWKDGAAVRSFKDTEWYRVECTKCSREVIKAEKFCPNCGTDLKDAKVTRKNDIYAYIDWMVPRLTEMHRILKNTGSIYLHADHHAIHYLKIEMDRIFGNGDTNKGIKCFKNEIIWSYKRWSSSKTTLPRIHDTILWYTKRDKGYTFNQPMQPNTNPNTSQYVSAKDGNGKTITLKDDKGKPIKRKMSKEIQIGDVWEMSILSSNSKERTGYPTQKPEALLDRIIKASSNENNIVFDPFSGCGTSAAVAQKLNRQYIGIDVSSTACRTIAERLKFKESEIIGMPHTLEEYHKMEEWEFQNLVCNKLNAKNTSPHKDKPSGSDGGKDGIIKSDFNTTDERFYSCPISVKRSKKVGVQEVRMFETVIRNLNKEYGFIVALSFSKGKAMNDQLKLTKSRGINIILVDAEGLNEFDFKNQIKE